MGGQTTMTARVALMVLMALHAAPAVAWNATGHKVVAEIAWRQLTDGQRQAIVDTLRRHPRFDADFARRMPDDVTSGDKADQDHWVFQAAAYWPDVARDGPYDRPKWHYVNFPLFVDPADHTELTGRLTANVSAEYPNALPKPDYNVLQAIKYCRSVLASRLAPENKALAYCWLFHLVGDIHQPLHAVSLYSVTRFPEGDRGENEIPLRRGRNLHALWDGLLGSGDSLREVNGKVAKLSGRDGDVWDHAAKETDPRKWADESRALAELFAYSDVILDAIRNVPLGTDLASIDPPTEYMQEAGGHARQRIIAAGIRLGALLKNTPDTNVAQPSATPAEPLPETAVSRLLAPSKPSPVKQPQYWLNTSSNVRHNSSCKWFNNTKRGRFCSATEGKPCGECEG